MNFKYPNTKNLISKDFNVANNECKKILETCDTNTFSDLCENCDCIFDFIKTKINKNFLNNVTQKNYLNLLKFAKIYSADFEEFIVMGLVKFANEDLTDDILEKFETGCDEEKAYYAKYFYYIQDPLALDYLREYAMSDFSPLSYNCAQTLNKFNDRILYDKEIEIIKGDFDDFEKIKAVNFLSAYGDSSAFDVIYDYMASTPFLGEVVESLLELNSLDNIELNKALVIYNNLLDLYPEFISLETLIPYGIKEFAESLQNREKTPFVSYVLYKTKMKFDMLTDGDVYTYDLSKEAKNEVLEIAKMTKKFDENLKKQFGELFNIEDDKLVENVLDTISENGLNSYKEEISNLLNKSNDDIIIYKCLNTLKSLGENLPPNITNKIKSENIKIMAKALY